MSIVEKETVYNIQYTYVIVICENVKFKWVGWWYAVCLQLLWLVFDFVIYL